MKGLNQYFWPKWMINATKQVIFLHVNKYSVFHVWSQLYPILCLLEICNLQQRDDVRSIDALKSASSTGEVFSVQNSPSHGWSTAILMCFRDLSEKYW